MRLRRWILVAVTGLVLFGGAVYLLRVPFSLQLLEWMAAERLSRPVTNLPDGLHVGLCGAGSPLADSQRSAPCTLVLAGQRLLIIDAGVSAAQNLSRMGFDPGRIEAIFLTHFHSDHIGGLGELMLQRWVSGGHAQPVAVYGPSGVKAVVAGFMQAYQLDQGYRVAHHGPEVVPPLGFGGQALTFSTPAQGEQVVLEDGELQVVAFSVEHAPAEPAVGYRIRYKDRSLVISGDTRVSATLTRAAAGVDLLVHEALSRDMLAVLQRAAEQAGRPAMSKIFADIPAYHSTPEQAARVAREAAVDYLLLNHIVPPLPSSVLHDAFLGQARSIYRGPLQIGRDGDFISLPSGTREILASRRW